jgi:Holliday junction resolvasome RuvABC endonuclease subunit
MSKAKKGVVRGEQKKKCTVSKKCISDPKFVGLDLSYVGTGLLIVDSVGGILEQKLIKTSSELETEDRLIQIEKEIKFIPNIVGLASVYIEGPSYASMGNQMLQMGALNFFVRIFLRKKKVEFKIVAPPTLKKWVTGNGRANKKDMLEHVSTKWGINFKDHNLADAYGLARMAMEEYKNV